MDKIKINNIELYAYHGVSNEEKTLGQIFQIDVELQINKLFSDNDLIESTIDYTKVFKIVSKKFVQPINNLIETAANRVANNLIELYDVKTVKIIVRKPSVPIGGICDSVEIEVNRNKNEE